MKTVFDLVGKFMKLGDDHMVRGELVVLVPALTPSQCAFGKARLEQLAEEKWRPLVKPGKYWFKDWDLVERHVSDNYEIPVEKSDESIHAKAA